MPVGLSFAGSPGKSGMLRINGLDYDTIDQGTWAASGLLNYSDSSLNNGATGASGDKLTFYMYLPKGSYKTALIVTKGPSAGIMKIDVDGTNIITYDAYSAGVVYSVRSDTAGVSCGNDFARSKIEVYSNTKNAGSSAFVMDFQSLVFIPEA